MLTYSISVASLMLIYVLLCISFDLLAGDLRLMSLATPALAGIGAYVAAHAEVTWALPDLASLVLAVAAAMLGGLVVAVISMRVSGDYFLLVTMSVGLIAFTGFNQFRSVTGGPSGFPGVQPMKVPGVSAAAGGLIVAAVLVVIVAVAVTALRRSRIGRRCCPRRSPASRASCTRASWAWSIPRRSRFKSRSWCWRSPWPAAAAPSPAALRARRSALSCPKRCASCPSGNWRRTSQRCATWSSACC